MYGQGGTLAVNVAALGNSYRMLSQQNRQVKTHVARSSQGGVIWSSTVDNFSDWELIFIAVLKIRAICHARENWLCRVNSCIY